MLLWTKKRRRRKSKKSNKLKQKLKKNKNSTNSKSNRLLLIAVIQVKLLAAEIQVIPVPTADRLLLSRLYQGKNCTNTCLNLYQLNSRHNKADTNMVSADFLVLCQMLG